MALEAVEALADEVAQERDPVRRLPEVRERREAARGPDRVDRLDRREARPRHVARLAVRQEPLERVLDALGEPGRDEGARDGRPAQRVVRGEVEGRDLGVDRQPDLAQPLDGRVEAGAAGAALARERGLERVVRRVDADPQHVELALEQVEPEAAGHGVDLDCRDERQVGGERRRAGRDQLPVPGEVVVVRDGEQPDPRVVRLADELGGLEDAVGAGRVGVDVGDRVAGVNGSPSSGRGAWRAEPDVAIRPRPGAGCARSGWPGRSPGRCRSGRR